MTHARHAIAAGIGAVLLLAVGAVTYHAVMPPAIAGVRLNPDTQYVASAMRQPFHKPDCRWAKRIDAENLTQFTARQDAMRAHRPCKVCRP